MVAVSLVSRAGYFRQAFDDQGRQVERAAVWDPGRWSLPLDAKIAVSIEGRSVWICAWLYVLEGQSGVREPVLLLDTNLPENSAADREITHFLYGGDDAYRLKQEVVLGIGGVRLLRALGFDIRQYHLNEGHSALLALELLRSTRYALEAVHDGESAYDIPRVREICCFTTQTPVDAALDRFSYERVARVAPDLFDLPTLKRLAGEQSLNMTRLALNLSEHVNGVAKSHALVAARMYPGYRLHAITNGVHPQTWAAESFRRLYDKHLPGWRHEPELLVRADCCIPDAAIWDAHVQCKQELSEGVRERTGQRLQADIPVIGFARRLTAYKRPDLLFRTRPASRPLRAGSRCRSSWQAKPIRGMREAGA